MFSFFQARKPRRYKHKAQYQKSTSEKKEANERTISFTQKKFTNEMYDRYDRIPFSDIKKAGRNRIMTKAIILAVILSLLIIYFDKLEDLLSKLE
ncbi:MAG: hypothetical protein ACI9U0_000057 [Flavobacteriales bacterium]|jgi:hypothetical protein|tara:strand:+ start:9936 stop:10220 length:285 start_codon:yes stop_codon:yes gene_type:complete